MRYQFFLIVITAIIISGCGGTPEPTRNNQNSANSNSTKPANSGPIATTKTPETAKTGEAPTIAPVVQGFYDALAKKDEAGAKKFLSASALKYYEDEAKSEKKTWFVYVSEESDPVAEKREVRNEKVEGDKAIAELKGGQLGVWTKVVFVKEGGEWKFASPKETISENNIPKTNAPANAAK